jgi:hypothetical protein
MTENPFRLSSDLTRHAQSGVALNMDVLYLILDYSVGYYAGQRLGYQSQQAALLVYTQVSRLWSQAAQRLLFRHVFLQIRSTMISFLRSITPSTSRGRLLASFVRSVTLKLCRLPEASMHNVMGFIHPRHLSMLLAHLPSLHTLNLRMGGEDPWTKADLAALSGRMSCRRIRMTSNRPFDQIFIPTESNPWRHIQSLSLFYASSFLPEFYLSDLTPPSFSLIHFECGGFPSVRRDELLWLLGNSHRTLRHCTMQFATPNYDLNVVLGPHVKSIESLTLYTVSWDASFSSFIQTFSKLRELRITTSLDIATNPDFPGVLPARLEHLAVPLPLSGASIGGYSRKFIIPNCLKTYTRIRNYGTYDDWDAGFSEACRACGVQVEERAKSTGLANGWGYGPGPTNFSLADTINPDSAWDTSEPKIRVPLISPAPELMNLTSVEFDFEDAITVYSHKPQPNRTLNIEKYKQSNKWGPPHRAGASR